MAAVLVRQSVDAMKKLQKMRNLVVAIHVVVVVVVVVMMMMMNNGASIIIGAYGSSVDCNTVTAFISACSTFVTYGSPDPIPGTPCCQAVASINTLATSRYDRQSICRCLMGLITLYNPNATAIATLPGFCGVSLGFIIAPNTDCNYVQP